jgi:DNA mismatch repair protein MutL
MPDIIHLLPDSIANQIAAGEVIQRPASVVKELVENSIDAGATQIQIVIKNAGKTLIQVIDNGKGMSATDARMAFERHATSKIQKADDLFSLTTMGFRGEALPSIAAISQVEVKTRKEEDEIGTRLSISGSKVEEQEAISCAKGTIISVKNIFFNVPARRKFLKSNESERRNILMEIERLVLANPDIEFSLIENDIQTLQLPPGVLRKRIVQLVGKNINQQLIEINEETTLGKIHGYVTKPESAKKSRANQFFFVNGRFIRHPYFHRAVMTAFEPLLPPNKNPDYFIYFEVDPSSLDVNIHPTKTEVKFENEQALWQILMVTVKEALGKFNALPPLDFDREDAIEIPIYDESKPAPMPKVNINPNYNPFHTIQRNTHPNSLPHFDWETLYRGFKKEKPTEAQVDPLANTNTGLFYSSENENADTEILPDHYQYKQKYILTSVKSGLMIIDQHRAHIRILFDTFLEQIKNKKGVSQRVLFPEIIELSPSEAATLSSIAEDLQAVGFKLNSLGNHSFAIQGIPSEIASSDPISLIRSIIEKSMETALDVKSEIQESIALSLAHLAAIPYGRTLTPEEMSHLINRLFACRIPNYSPDGHPIVSLISDEEIAKKMKSSR